MQSNCEGHEFNLHYIFRFVSNVYFRKVMRLSEIANVLDVELRKMQKISMLMKYEVCQYVCHYVFMLQML